VALWDWDQPWELEGRFWTPADHTRFYGRLTHGPQDGPIFHFVDTTLASDGHRGPSGPIDVLLGETLGGLRLSVFDFFTTHWRDYGLGSGNTLEGFAQSVLTGVWLDAGGDLQITGLGVDLHGLRELLNGGEVDPGPLHASSDEHGRGGQLSVTLGDGVELGLRVGESRSVSAITEHSELTARAFLKLQAPMRIADVEARWLDPLRDLVLFATRRQSYVRNLKLVADPPLDQEAQILRRPYPRPDARGERAVYSLALNLAGLDAPERLFQSWFALHARIGPVWQLFFSTLASSGGLLENRFLNMVAFAEGYHRALHDQPPLTSAQDRAAKKVVLDALRDSAVRRVYREAVAQANSQSQRARLAWLVQRALRVLDSWQLDGAEFCTQVSHTRNWLVHWGKRGEQAAEDPAGLAQLVDRLEVVLYVNLMLDLGLSGLQVAEQVASGWRLQWPP
jgi:hypothetical protein